MRATHHLTLLRPDAERPGRRTETDAADLWIALSALAIGVVPFAGYTLLGHWNERELGLAALLLIFGMRGVALSLFRRYG